MNLHCFLWTKAHPIHPVQIREHPTELQFLRTLKINTASWCSDDV